MQEVWKNIEGFDDVYQISNFGRIKTVGHKYRNRSGHIHKRKSRVLKTQVDSMGYLMISISYKKKVKTWRVHRLVAIYFVDNPQHLPEVNHIDGNPLNPRWDNLEWCTRSHNCFHKVEVMRHYGRFDDKPRGAFFDKSKNAYRSDFSYRKNREYLGTFKTESEAYHAYFEKFKAVRGHEPWDLKKYPTH